jgi:hypothetical protein
LSAPVDWSYTLDENERLTCINTAASRRSTNRKRKVKDRMVGNKRDPAIAEAEGMVAELAFGKMSNLYVDLRTVSGAQKADFIAPTGTVDVKSTNIPTGRLIVPAWKAADPCDWYVLMIVKWEDIEKCPTAQLVGGIHRLGIIKPERLVYLGYDSRQFGMHQHELIQPDELMPLILSSSCEQD